MGYTVNPTVSQVAEMSKAWHPSRNQDSDPTRISSGSPKKFWWRCDQFHEYERSALLQLRGVRCPICRSLGFMHPNLVEQWDFDKNPETPFQVGPGSQKKFFWLCPSGHTIFRTPGKVTDRGLCCSPKGDGTIKRGRLLLPGENDLATKFPELISQWSPLETSSPGDYHPTSNKKVLWRCSNLGHDYEMSVGNKTKGYGCPFCSNQRVLPGLNDLGTTRPELVSEWHPTKNANSKMSDISGNSSRKFWWLCSKGHEWNQSPNGRHPGGGCPVCSNQTLLRGVNDLETVNPSLAEEWDGERNGTVKPSDVMPGSLKNRWWKCRIDPDHLWQASPSTRRRGHGCPYCAGLFALAGKTDVATTHPSLAMQIDRSFHSEDEIRSLIAGTGKPIHWICPDYIEHKYVSNGAKRLQGNGCPYCSGHQVWPGFNDLATRNPALAAEWDYERNAMLRPEQVTAGSNKSVHWVCARDDRHRWKARPATRRWSGCPACSPGGFSAASPGTLYFLEHLDFRAMKVGITATGSNRLMKFQKAGWKLVKIWDFPLGATALDIETLFFRWVRKEVGLPVYLGQLEMGASGGFSETFENGPLSQSEVVSKIEEIAHTVRLDSVQWTETDRDGLV